MRIALTISATIAMIVATNSMSTTANEPTNPTRVRRLTAEEIHNPIIRRIDNLTWDDQEIMDALKSFAPKRQAAFLKQRKNAAPKQTKVPYQIRNVVKLKYLDDGGAVLPMPEEPTPWVTAKAQPIVSLGLVPCYNSMEQGMAVSKKTGKPILVISTELPGCSACTGLGHRQLSHPFVVDATMEFTPVVIAGGWPWLQVRTADGQPIGEKVTHQSSTGDLLKMLRDGLRGAKRDVPAWLEFVTKEQTAKRETTAFAMGCFWSGERKLGKLDGVISTRVGNRAKRGEWVEVEFDPTVLSYEELVEAAAEMQCTSGIIARTDAQAAVAKKYVSSPQRLYRDDESLITATKYQHDDKHSIVNSKRFGHLPMTPSQATRINALGKQAEKYLSPSQLILLQKLEDLQGRGTESNDLGPKKPNWLSLDSFDSDARSLQARLGMTPHLTW